MAFQKKTWKDRVSEQPQRRLITPVGGGTSTTVDVTRQEGIVIQEGDAFSAANMNDLENRIKTTLDADEASIRTINTRSTTNANNIASLQNNVASLNTSKAPTNHASSNTTYGKGSSSLFGHVKVSDSYNVNVGANEGVAATPKLVGLGVQMAEAFASTIGNGLGDHLKANNTEFYFDYKNGKYGFNTDANRGADTFHPFKGDVIINLQETVNLGDMSEGHSYSYSVPRECQVLSVWVAAIGWQRIEMSISAGTTIYANTDHYGGGAAALFTQVPSNAVITFTGSGEEPNDILASIYMSAE